jgi:glycosyltransferase involved in cell wall biosynthesis
VQHLPASATKYRNYLPLFPAAIERFRFDGYDLVISSSHCVAKSAIVPDAVPHLCYCHSPMRYAWDQFDAYFGPDQVGAAASRVLRPVLARMARWDARTASRVDRFVANSQYVAGRIARYYNRESTVVYPPVDTAFYHPDPSSRGGGYALVVSALVPYKRLDVAVRAAAEAGIPLKIVGRGPEESRLRAAAPASTEFLGWLTNEEIRDLYQRCAVVLMPGIEDFGMVPVEAMACGRPVIALAEGGATESVAHGTTGLLVNDPSAAAFAAAIRTARETDWDPAVIRAHAERFSLPRFLDQFSTIVSQMVTRQ